MLTVHEQTVVNNNERWVDGGYIFVQRLLMEHFTEMYKE